MDNVVQPTRKRRNGAAVIVALVLLVVIAIIILLLLRQKGKDSRGFVTEENADSIVEEMDQGMFECKMTTSWTFEDSDSPSSDAYVANAEGNLHTLYFDVYESSTDKLLYSSPLVPVGSDIRNIKLDKKLDAGEYDAVVMYTLVDDDEEELSSVGFNITISVRN